MSLAFLSLTSGTVTVLPCIPIAYAPVGFITT